MPRLFGLILIFSLFAALNTSNAEAAKRFALVIGNSTYTHAAAHKTALQESNRIAGTLRKLGYQVFHLNNLRASSLHRMVQAFVGQAAGSTSALVYFAGYGVEQAGQTFLVPTDARPGDLTGLVALADVTRPLAGIGAGGAVMLDIAAQSPFAGSDTGLTRGLTRISSGTPETAPVSGSVIGDTGVRANHPVPVLVAGRPGSHDGASPFAAHVLKVLQEPSADWNDLVVRVKTSVPNASGNLVRPYLLGAVQNAAFSLNDLPAASSSGQAALKNSLIIRSAFGDTYSVNDTLSILIKTSYDCHLHLFNIDAKTQQVIMVFPNKFQQSQMISSGGIVRFPSRDAPFQMRLHQPGEEKFVAICSSKPGLLQSVASFRSGAFQSISRDQFDAMVKRALELGTSEVLTGQLAIAVN